MQTMCNALTLEYFKRKYISSIFYRQRVLSLPLSTSMPYFARYFVITVYISGASLLANRRKLERYRPECKVYGSLLSEKYLLRTLSLRVLPSFSSYVRLFFFSPDIFVETYFMSVDVVFKHFLCKNILFFFHSFCFPLYFCSLWPTECVLVFCFSIFFLLI